MQKVTKNLKINQSKIVDFLGVFDENLTLLSRELDVAVFIEDGFIKIVGENKKVGFAETVIQKLIDVVNSNEPLDKTRILYCIEMAKSGELKDIETTFSGVVAVTFGGKKIKPKTVGQKKYVDAINNNTVIFGVGPAGTGKTYLAVCMASLAYKQKQIEKII